MTADLSSEIPSGHIGWDGELVPTQDTAEEAVRTLIKYLRCKPDDEMLCNTPKRVVKAFEEMVAGLREDPATILTRQFDVQHDEMVVLKGVPFVSLCSHHLLPFSGVAAVAYIPQGGKVVGLSKLARLVLCYARRPQVQEQLTGQVADAIEKYLQPVGCACVIEAEHACMACRGVKVSGTTFITSALRGVLKTDTAARAEFMSLLR